MSHTEPEFSAVKASDSARRLVSAQKRKHQCARIEAAFMCRADPAQFPLLSSSPDSCTHWAERQRWESGVAGRRHDGHMWSCGGLPQERKKEQVNWKRHDRNAHTVQIEFHRDKLLISQNEKLFGSLMNQLIWWRDTFKPRQTALYRTWINIMFVCLFSGLRAGSIS